MATKEQVEFVQNVLRGQRYGVAWRGNPKMPTHEEMPDGYWVPWHLADLLLGSLKDDDKSAEVKRMVLAEREACAKACEEVFTGATNKHPTWHQSSYSHDCLTSRDAILMRSNPYST